MKIILTLLLSAAFFLNLTAQCTQPAGDNDGDGIPDSMDLDDDNDGILDLDETGRGSINWSAAQLSSFQTTAFSASLECGTAAGFQCNPLIPQLTSFGVTTTAINNTYQTILRADINNPAAVLSRTMQFAANVVAANTAYGNITISLTPGSLYEFNIYLGDPELTSFKITAFDASNQILGTTDWCTATYRSNGASPSTAMGSITTSATDVTYTANNRSLTYDALRVRFGETTLSQATSIVIEMSRFNGSDGSGDGIFFFVSGTCRPDADGDSIPNDKDNDSDSDGCPDALEGGGTFKYPDLDANGMFNVPVNVNGVPVTAGVPQTVGTSANALLFDLQSACAFPETYAISLNQPGMPATLNLASGPLQGSDETDQPGQGSWAGKKIIITSLPTNGFELIYNGSTVTQNQVINPYVDNLLSIQPGPATAEGITTTTFQYSTIDIADQQDQTSADYTITWALALPLNLIDFSVFYNNQCRLEFKWTSEDEINFRGYAIEKSSDGQSFTAITYVQGKGGAENKYVYVQNALNETYFRLRMENVDGTVTYSKTILVINKCDIPKTLRLFPVPAGNIVTLSGLNAGDRIMVYNTTGNVLISETNISGNSKTINIQSLPSGIYTMRILSAGGSRKTMKLIKQL
ncbi:MAG: T9SS type A sorting domain-containing protein [Chitinophagaceae bacterium]|nr:T9SS type A sorting domain-containing protein [Chitinophagaceae bacterium]